VNADVTENVSIWNDSADRVRARACECECESKQSVSGVCVRGEKSHGIATQPAWNGNAPPPLESHDTEGSPAFQNGLAAGWRQVSLISARGDQ
jgi:hypothetical protein